MEEWKEYRLGDVLCNKGYIRGPFGSALKRGDLLCEGIPVYEQQHAIYNKRDFRFYISEDKYNEMKRFTVYPDDIIISCSGTVGEVSLIKKNDPKGIISQALLLLRVDNKIISPEFLLYFFKTAKGHNSITSRSSGSVQVNIARREVIEDIPLFIPCIEKQKRIVSILKSLDDKIEVNRKTNENLEQEAQALFKSWFIDFEPFKNGEFVESELGMIPKGWRVCRADEVFDINIGKTPPRKEPEWFTKNTSDNIWVSIADMGSCGMFVSESSEYLTNEAINRFNILMVDEGSVLLSFKLTVGRVAIADTRLTTNEAIARFQLPQSYYREFLYLYLKQYKYGNLGSTSSIATAVNSKTIKGMKLITPPEEVISCFSKHTKPLFDKIKVLSQESRRLAELRDTLLPKLMSGELKVNEIENVL